MDKWYQDMFKGELGKYLLHSSDLRKELTEKEIPFLENAMKTGLILDHCCRAGRLSIPLSSARARWFKQRKEKEKLVLRTFGSYVVI